MIKHNLNISCTTLLALVLTACAIPAVQAAPPNYEDDVRPILKKHCLSCHNADKKENGLDLSSFKSVQLGSSGGAVVKAGLPKTSPLYLAISHHEDYAPMPPNKPKLAAPTLKKIHDWIAGGLLATAGGKSQLREVAFNISAGSMKRPKNPAFPTILDPQPIAKTVSAPAILALACSPWSNLIASSGHRQVLLFGNETSVSGELQYLGALPFPEGDIHDIRFSRNGELLVVAGGIGADSGNVAVFEVRSGKRIATLGDEYDIVLSADITADHKYVAVGTPAKLVKVYSTKDGKLVHRIKKHTDWVTVVRFSPDGQQLASADRNGGIHIWEMPAAGILYSLSEHKTKVTSLSWRQDSKVLASGAEDGHFILWDMKDGWATRSIPAHVGKARSRYSRRSGILDIQFAHDGQLITTGRDHSLRSWKADGSSAAKAVDTMSLPLSNAISPDGQHAFIGGFDGTIQIWNVRRSKLQQLINALQIPTASSSKTP